MTGMFKVTLFKLEGKRELEKEVYLIASSESEAEEVADSWYKRFGWIAAREELVGTDALSNIFEVVGGQLKEIPR